MNGIEARKRRNRRGILLKNPHYDFVVVSKNLECRKKILHCDGPIMGGGFKILYTM